MMDETVKPIPSVMLGDMSESPAINRKTPYPGASVSSQA
jgi:hypothetical protein